MMFSKDEVSRGLETLVVGKRVFVFESIDSTNQCAKTLADTGAVDGTVVVADHQTSGRGRQGRTWESPPNSNLLLSIILRLPAEKQDAGLLTFLAAVSVARALEAVTSLHVECKWPNDLLLNGKKCCGILLENSFQGGRLLYSVVGVGININQAEFPGTLKNVATSIAVETGKLHERLEILRAILRSFDSLYREMHNSGFDRILREWNSRCTMFGRRVALESADRPVAGIAVGLSPDGGLVLQTSEGERVVHAGDISTMAEVR